MSDQNDTRPSIPETTAVPGLIERYRLRREAWIAQADELARLRDEVRSAAEREAMEIVTAARRDVRQVIMEARRELLVLSAQVQAALGDVSGKPDPTLLLNRGASQTAAASAAGLRSIATETPADLFVPESAVKTMLDEARADMEALAEDAKTVPFQAMSLAGTTFPALPLDVTPIPAPAPKVPLVSAPPPLERPPSLLPAEFFDDDDDPRVRSPLDQLEDALEPDLEPEMPSVAPRVLSSPFPIDSVAVPGGRPVGAFVAAFAVVAVVIIGGSYWWLRAHSESPAVAATSTSAKGTDAKSSASTLSAGKPGSAPVSASTVRTSSSPSRLSVLVEARREAWIRTTRDGQADDGRTYAAGEKIQLDANHDISVRAGNAGAVFVVVNKGVAMPLGREGQVLTRQFLAEAAPPPASAAQTAAVANAAPTSAAGLPLNSRLPAGGPVIPSPLPVPLVQPGPSFPNVPPIDAAAPAARTEPSPLPRAEAATAPPQVVAPPVSPSSGPQTASTSAVVTAARQWLEAYHRQERSAMASLSTGDLQLADERRADERFPANMDVSRTLDKVSVQIAADTAVLTAVMTERGDTGTQRVSPVSLVWVLSGGQWRARQVRLVSEARLNQIFR